MATHARVILVGALAAFVVGCAKEDPAADTVTAAEAKAIAQEAYLFGLPLVYIAVQAEVMTNVARLEEGRAPFNQFDQHRTFPDAANNKIVGMNVDSLYSIAQLDVTTEPIVLVVPPIDGNRWWIMQIVDAWNDVPAAPGSRTHGGNGRTFAIVGPTFNGTLPAGLEEIRVDTSLLALGGRTYTNGPADYAAVHEIQDQYQLIPLSQWKGAGTSYSPPASVPVKPNVDAATPVPTQVFNMSANQFFGRLNELLVNNPAREVDAPIMTRLTRLGIGPGAPFTTDTFDTDTRTAIDEGIAAAQQAIRDEESKLGEIVNGWQIARDLGRYGTKYTYRAAWTFFGVGGNLAEDAIYPVAVVDSDGQRLTGTNAYVLRFAKDQIPPVDAFWSVTMYDKDSYLVDNSLDRYALGDRSDMAFGDDGSLTIYIQSESPGGDNESNWLPAPKDGPFKLALRLYVPKQEVADGTWKPPSVQRVQ